METIYNWLLENTGNAGNYYTILNTNREGGAAESATLTIRVRRTDDFTVLNLLVSDGQKRESPESEPGSQVIERYHFANEQAVIAYLASGQKPDEADSAKGIQVSVLEPTGEAGEVTFP
ncbi:hypothetical protein [Spirosoma oryzicola]|uniref:hypothetical protein n=1 Tax=Spirosoma oryzicola TaxID=2898794 RepID=UPI001E474CAA|nr:hypothetical protein [Spirosoma oryzicola]UHG89256.1 hypothetical protein LQ777_13485 [Spirosoma oryzicola]